MNSGLIITVVLYGNPFITNGYLLLLVHLLGLIMINIAFKTNLNKLYMTTNI